MDLEIGHSIQKLFISNGWTLSTAESCTGGAIAARLTKIDGASRYFAGSVVAYSNYIKEALLGVPADLIAKHGAVSAEVVAQMAKGVLKLTKTDYAAAVSGVAGPTGGTTEKPVGTVWAAIARKGEEPVCWTFHINGNREQVIETTVDLVLLQILNTIPNPC